MDCHEAKASMSAFMDDELDAASATELELHLRQCGHCRDALAKLRRVDVALRGLPQMQLGPDFTRSVMMIVSEGASTQDQLPERASPVASPKLLDRFRELFGIEKSTPHNSLHEFNDSFPLSIGATYFGIFGD